MGTTTLELTKHTVNQKYSDYIQPTNQNLYKLINERLKYFDPLWPTKKILDFGCNNGNLLRSSQGIIEQKNYTGIDVQVRPLEIAKREFPFADWILYNGYHPAFNSTGSENLHIENKFDIIFCIGVFTHCDIKQIKSILNVLRNHLNPNGYIIFSIWEDFHFIRYCNIFLRYVLEIKVPENVYQNFSNSIYLIDRCYSIVDTKTLPINSCDWMETFYTRKFLETELGSIDYLDGPHSLHSIFLTK